jgi:Fur family transcriptional regulator, peroxide stress response regulator
MNDVHDRDFIAVLREHGLQVTYQRLAIYQVICEHKEHPSAEEIYQQVRKRFPMISLGTVYKTLERFHEVGLIQKVSPVTEVARYEANTTHHHHMICLECQTIQDFEDADSNVNLAAPEGSSFKVLRRQVVLQGYCAHCKPK